MTHELLPKLRKIWTKKSINDCLEQKIYASPENFTPALLPMPEPFRRSTLRENTQIKTAFFSGTSLTGLHHQVLNQLAFFRDYILVIKCNPFQTLVRHQFVV